MAPMLTKDIAVKAITFRREGFKRFAEVSMSRRYIKNALFLALFACLTIAIYTVVLNAKRGTKRDGFPGFVQNMEVQVPGAEEHEAYKQFDENVDDRNDNLEGKGRNLEEGLPPNRLPQWPDRREDDDEAEAYKENQNIHDRLPIWPERKEDHNEAEVYRNRQNEDIEREGDQDAVLGHNEHELPLNDAVDSNEDVDDDGDIDANNEEAGDARTAPIDFGEVKVTDSEGNVVGYKHFPFGIQPRDMNKSPEERERDLRRRLGLPPKQIKSQREEVPAMPNEPREPNVLPRPRNEIIHVGGIDKKPGAPKKYLDNLGAFRLKDRVPNKVDAFLGRDNFNDNFDDKLEHGDMKDDHMDDDLSEDRFDGGENPQLARLDDRIRPANRDQIFPPRDAYLDRFAPKKNIADYANRLVNPNRRADANIGNIIRPIGNNGMNPFHSGEVEGRDNNNIMPDRMPERGGMAPFAPNQGMPGRNQIQNAPMNNNRMVPPYLQEGAVPNDRGMDPFEHQRVGLRPDALQNAQVNNRGMDAFGRNPERLNDPVQAGNIDRNPVDHRNEGIGGDLLDIAHGEDSNPFARKALGNREDARVPEPMHNGINAGPDLAQDRADSLLDSNHAQDRGNSLLDTNHDENQQVGQNNSTHNNTSESKPLVTLNPIPVEETDEPVKPLVIKDIKKPLPVTADCIPFLFPPKQGTLCVHEPIHDRALSGVIKARGIWEPSMLSGFFGILKTHPELNVVDIGAGIGIYTLTAAMMDRKVMAVEPLYFNYRMLHKSALENEVSEKITLVAQAIGSESYLGHLNYSDDTGGYSQVRVDRIADDQADVDSPDVVQVTTLNNLVQALPFDAAVLKIDVGGFMEPEVLTSSSKFFKALRVPYVFTHWNFHTGMKKKYQIASLLSQKGYHPRTEWNGIDVDPDVLQQDLNYLIWAL